MNQNQRPHSRNKTVGSGSADVGKGRRVGSSGPVGNGGRSGHDGSSNRVVGLPKKSFGIVGVIVVIVLLFLLIKSCGGENLFSWLNFGDIIGGDSLADVSESIDNSVSYSTPDRSVSPLARAKKVKPLGNGDDVVTIMVYMCGTDLESKHGMASADLKEMTKSKIADNVNVIVLTGGCSQWQTKGISSQVNQIYKVESNRMVCLEKDFGSSTMTDPNNLTRFIQYASSRYPATRNFLIMWDHGGGTISGYGYDEKDPKSGSMTLVKFSNALKAAKVDFDFIGFDACLMATLETDLVCANYADYLIASEETEPGTGWYYTNWLTKLSQDTSMPTIDISQNIIDDFVAASCSASSSAGVTLSVVDLAELEGTLPDSFKQFSAATTEMIKSNDYQQVSKARANARQFAASSKINQVDLIDLATRMKTNEGKDLAKTLKSCVKYNKSTLTNSYGVSIYFPYENTSSVKQVTAEYNQLDMDDEYTKCITSFASLGFAGQLTAGASQIPTSSAGDLLSTILSSYTSSSSSAASGSSSPVGALLGSFLGGASSVSSAGNGVDASTLLSLLGGLSGRSMPENLDWVDTELIANQAENIVKNTLDASRLIATKKDGKTVLDLTDEEWACVDTVELNVFVDDENGFIDLGYDNVFEWNDENSILLNYDRTWMTLNGKVCAYYLVSDTARADGTYITEGRIPALLNGKFVNLRVVFDEKLCPEGQITGAYLIYDDECDVQAKGDIKIKKQDKIELLCDYYNRNGQYEDTYSLGSAITVPASGLKIENMQLNVSNVDVTYRVTDYYGNHFWIPVQD